MKYVIIGGDAAGMTAAMEIVRNDKKAQITTLEQTEIYSYGQCGLPYVVDGRIPSTDDLIARSVQVFREKYGIDARTGHKVTRVDAGKQIVYGEGFEVPYDKLLIATGAAPIMPKWDNATLAGIHTIKTIPQMHDLLRDATEAKKVAVIGGGYIGLEMAEVLKEAGKDVCIIQRGAQLAKMLDADMVHHVHEQAVQHDVAVYLDTAVTGFNGETKVEAVVTNKGTIEADLVIVAVGVKPSTDFLADTAILRLKNGAIVVDPHMATSVENIYAAGDCATHFNRIKQSADYVPLGTTANKQGRIAGLSMAGKFVRFKGITGTSILKFFDLAIATTGLNEVSAQQLNRSYHVYELTANHIASYYPEPKPLFIKVLVEKKTERLLGAQIIGEAGVDKRIDVFATALMQALTLRDLLDLDLAYAPPFNGVWDPLQQLAKRNVPV